MVLTNSKKALIIAADSREARLFTRQGDHDPLTPMSTLHPAADMSQDREDKGRHEGHMRSDHRSGGVAVSPRMDPLRKRHMAFAHQLAEYIDNAIDQGSCDELVIAASCPFLGELRSVLSAKAKKRLAADIDLDLMAFGLSELERRLDEQLRLIRIKAAS